MNLGELINGFFDHVFIITLPRSTHRQEAIIKELNNYNIKFSFIEGVNGRELDIDLLDKQKVVDKALNIEITKMPISKGELGCSLSVLKVCKKIVQENFQSVLILQDDVKIISENIKYCNELLSGVTFPWDLIYLGHSEMFMKMPLGIRLRMFTIYPLRYKLNLRKQRNPQEIRNTFRKPFTKNWFIAGEHNGGYAYGLSLEGAKKLVDAFTPVFAPDDLTFRYLIRKGRLRAFSPSHFLFDQRHDFESEVGERPTWGIDWNKNGRKK
jgi:glycosyl transferase, family 25